MRNISNINFIRKIPNQTLKAKYYPPKTRRDIEEQLPNFNTMTPKQIKDFYSNNFLNDYRGDFIEDEGLLFRYKDGTEDVYVKSGYESDVFEYLDRNMMDKKKYRIITDTNHIDFVAGGRVEIDGVFFEVIKVIAMTSDVSTQNKFRAMKGVKDPQRFAPKLIALI